MPNRRKGEAAAANGDRRSQIVEVGTQLFWEHGYNSTTTRDIGDAVGMLKGSLYYYFASKEDLLFQIIGDVHEEGLRRVDELRELDAPTMTKLRLFVERGVVFAARHVRELRIFFNDGRVLSPERQARLRQQRNAYDGYLRELLHTAQRNGEICPDVDTHAAATAVVGVINWTAYWYHADGQLRPETLAAEYADLIVNGLACDPRTHKPGHRRAFGSPGAKPKPARWSR